MRILMTTDTVGGVWTFTSTLTEQLLQRGHEVYLVSFGREPSPDQQEWSREQWRLYGEHFTVLNTTTPLEWMQDNEGAFEEGQAEILDDAPHFQPDLLVSNQFCFGALAATFPRVVVAHSDVLSWAKVCRGTALEPSLWLTRYTSMVTAGLRAADAVVAPTFSMAKAIVDHFPAPRGVEVIPNGARLSPTIPAAPVRKLQAITAGRLWDEAKGLDSLHNLRSPMPILVAGDHTFESTAAQTTWPDSLTFLGALPQAALHRHFRESAIYLCTSRYEPFGLAPLEAALGGCALVCRGIPSLREVWQNSALFFTDQTSLAHTLAQLADDPALLRIYQIRALTRAQEFTPERLADNYLALFHAVLRRHEAIPHVA